MIKRETENINYCIKEITRSKLLLNERGIIKRKGKRKESHKRMYIIIEFVFDISEIPLLLITESINMMEKTFCLVENNV